MELMLEGLKLKKVDIVEKIEDISQNALNRTEILKMSHNFRLKEGYKKLYNLALSQTEGFGKRNF